MANTTKPRTEDEKAARRRALREEVGLDPGTGEAALPLPLSEAGHQIARGETIVSETEGKILRTARLSVVAGLLPEALRLSCPMDGKRAGRVICLECPRVDGRCSATKRYLDGASPGTPIRLPNPDALHGAGPVCEESVPEAAVGVMVEHAPVVMDESGPPPINLATGRHYSSWAKFHQGQKTRETWAKKRAAGVVPDVVSPEGAMDMAARVSQKLRAEGHALGGDGVKAEPLRAYDPELDGKRPTIKPADWLDSPTPHVAMGGTWRGTELAAALNGLGFAVGRYVSSSWRVKVEIEREASS